MLAAAGFVPHLGYFALGVVVTLLAMWALPRLARWLSETIGQW